MSALAGLMWALAGALVVLLLLVVVMVVVARREEVRRAAAQQAEFDARRTARVLAKRPQDRRKAQRVTVRGKA